MSNALATTNVQAMFGALDGFAVRAGVITTVVLAVPLGLGAALLADADNRQLALAANLGVLVIFVLGSGLAAWVQRRQMPIAHGLVSAVASYAIVAVVSFVVSAFSGSGWSILRQALLMTIAAGCGLLGGMIGGILRSRGAVPSSDRLRPD